MKYLYNASKTALEAINRTAWETRLGRPKNPEDTTEFLCDMIVSGSSGELMVEPADEQHFTAAEQAAMTDTSQL